jgi:putative sterol carrier protein
MQVMAPTLHKQRTVWHSPHEMPFANSPTKVLSMPHPFLSEEWITEARIIRAKYEGQVPKIPITIRMNQIITKVPFGNGDIQSHIDTSTGVLVMDLGHIEKPDLTVTTDYETAHKVFFDQDPQAGMQAFMSGRIKVEGDVSKMLMMPSVMPASDLADQVAAEIRSITLLQ